MGVPRFFRWIVQRYPLALERLKRRGIPRRVDNLYVDFNGILHNSTHGDNGDSPTLIEDEEEFLEKSFHAICAYLDKIVHLVCPRKRIVIAADGVAPRAKMNQQRQRRFRAAIELASSHRRCHQKHSAYDDAADDDLVESEDTFGDAEHELEDKEVETTALEGESTGRRIFDSNAISPGTEFMKRMRAFMHTFIEKKCTDDRYWNRCVVVFSGDDVPGEGEHKIMDFIRDMKRDDASQANEDVHCLYGLDADLILLGLVTHLPKFMILREAVFAKDSSNPFTVKLDEMFELLHIHVIREYLALDFPMCEATRLVEDFVLLTTLVGNDFLPSLPSARILGGGWNFILQAYRLFSNEGNNYIMDNGHICMKMLEKFLGYLAEREKRDMKKSGLNLSYLAVRFETMSMELDQSKFESDVSKNEDRFLDIVTAGLKIEKGVLEGGRHYTDPRLFYYGEKLHLDNPVEDIPDIIRSYVEGLLWVTDYYYRGVSSWSWYYPHHYAPLALDMKDLEEHASSISFTLGAPFRPEEQLLSILPPLSVDLIPKELQSLVTDESSPLADYYPRVFDVERESGSAEWEGIALIPFIDEELLRSEIAACGYKICQENGDNLVVNAPSIGFPSHDLDDYILQRPLPSLQDWDLVSKYTDSGVELYGQPSSLESILVGPTHVTEKPEEEVAVWILDGKFLDAEGALPFHDLFRVEAIGCDRRYFSYSAEGARIVMGKPYPEDVKKHFRNVRREWETRKALKRGFDFETNVRAMAAVRRILGWTLDTNSGKYVREIDEHVHYIPLSLLRYVDRVENTRAGIPPSPLFDTGTHFITNMNSKNPGCVGTVLASLGDGRFRVKLNARSSILPLKVMPSLTGFLPLEEIAEKAGVSLKLASDLARSFKSFEWRIGFDMFHAPRDISISYCSVKKEGVWLFTPDMIEWIKQLKEKYPDVLESMPKLRPLGQRRVKEFQSLIDHFLPKRSLMNAQHDDCYSSHDLNTIASLLDEAQKSVSIEKEEKEEKRDIECEMSIHEIHDPWFEVAGNAAIIHVGSTVACACDFGPVPLGLRGIVASISSFGPKRIAEVLFVEDFVGSERNAFISKDIPTHEIPLSFLMPCQK